MAISRKQIVLFLSIYIEIGFMANSVYGATSPVPTIQTTVAAGPFCSRPNFTNPYAIVLDPDQPSYPPTYFYVELSCKDGHTPRYLNEYTYCYPDVTWTPDPTGGLCYAQCNTTELVADDDIIAMDDNDMLRTIFDDGEIAYFYCADQGQSSGPNQGTCKNGTLDFIGGDNPSCLAYCPVYIAEHGDGLYYEIANDPVINEDNQTLYYRDGDPLTYRCSDGYDGPINCTSVDCTSTCVDGTWDPPDIPVCEEIDECLSNPCQNNATCHDLINKYECECPDGFNGTLCEINIDDCANHTCQNGATCVDEVAAYECQCPDGYDGTYCENVVTTPTMTTVIMTTDNTTSLGSTSEPILTTAEQDVTTSEPTTSLGTTLSSTALTTSTDSSATSVITTDLVATTDTPAAATTVTVAATTITSDITTISPDASTITPDATTVTSGMATISEGTTAPTVPASTTKTTSVITTEMVVTTDTPAAATTVTSDATTVTPDATTVTSGMTMISKRTTAPSAATTAITAATTVNPDVTTITADATTVSPGTATISEETTAPTTPASTTKSDSPTLSVSTSSLSETTESKETTATSTKSPAEPRTTEKPPTPLPCEGECLPTQVCNAMDQCECRPDYYEDEDDNEEPCKVPTSIDVTMTITEVNGQNPVYKPGYEDPESDEFKALEKDVCQPFNEIYRNETDYEGCRVIEFTEGSIIVNYVLTFVENSTIGVSNVTETVYEELQNPNGSFSGELTFNDTSLSVAPYDECDKGNYDCDKNATCIDLDEKGYTCECFPEVYVLPGQECPELPTTELPPITTEEPKEPGMEVWKVVVGVTVPIVGILTITIVGLVCWQYRRLDRTSPVSESAKLRTKPYQEEIGGSDRDASRPGSMMIMNNDGTVQEVVLPWRNDSSEGEFIFAPDIDSKGKNQMLPMVDYPSNYGSSSDNDPLGNIVSSYDNYTYQNHDTRNTTEIDSRYF